MREAPRHYLESNYVCHENLRMKSIQGKRRLFMFIHVHSFLCGPRKWLPMCLVHS